VLRLVSDEDFDDRIVPGLFRRLPELDLVGVRDQGMAGIKDPDLLAWAAQHGRIVVTHDRNTMSGFAYDRVARGLPMAGVVVVSQDLAIGKAIDDLLVLVQCSSEEECKDRVQFIPL
jgi:hypothetical protein